MEAITIPWILFLYVDLKMVWILFTDKKKQKQILCAKCVKHKYMELVSKPTKFKTTFHPSH